MGKLLSEFSGQDDWVARTIVRHKMATIIQVGVQAGMGGSCRHRIHRRQVCIAGMGGSLGGGQEGPRGGQATTSAVARGGGWGASRRGSKGRCRGENHSMIFEQSDSWGAEAGLDFYFSLSA